VAVAELRMGDTPTVPMLSRHDPLGGEQTVSISTGEGYD